MQLPNSSDVRAFVRRTLHPKTKLGKTTLWFGYLARGARLSCALIFRPGPGSLLSGWANFIASFS